MPKRLLGRQPRIFNPRVPHMSAILGAMDLPAPPDSIDWTKGVQDFGMMLNDQLGCCTCAAVYHARQIWTLNSSTEITEPDSDVLALYEQACGYNPNTPTTDNGGVEQNVLSYLLNTGAPVGTTGQRNKILAFIEVDPRNIQDVKRTIADCGVAYIGFQVPSNIMPSDGEPPKVWDYRPFTTCEGGHAIVCVGYDANYVTVISWGEVYKMTWRFFSHYVDEVYAIADPSWFNSTGQTPLNMTIQQLETLMQAIKE